MKISELIKILKQYDPNLDVAIEVVEAFYIWKVDKQKINIYKNGKVVGKKDAIVIK